MILVLLFTAVVAYVIVKYPDFVVRVVVGSWVHAFYRVKKDGVEHIPAGGPVLLLANHLAFTDPFFVIAACPRSVRFLVFRVFFDKPIFKWAFKYSGCIPISELDTPKAIMKSILEARKVLENGEVLGVFAEGGLSRHGQLREFKKGFEKMAKNTEAAIIPVHMDGLWGSIFSYRYGKAVTKVRESLVRNVTLTFGPAMKKPVDAFTARQAVLELGFKSVSDRLSGMKHPAAEFIKTAQKKWFSSAVSDGSQNITYGELLTKVLLVSRRLRASFAPGDKIGIYMTPSADSAVMNMSAAFAGLVAVNLCHVPEKFNREETDGLDIKAVVVRRNHSGIVNVSGVKIVLWEELDAACGKGALFAAGILSYLIPASVISRVMLRSGNSDASLCAVFTGGLSRPRKAVMLSSRSVMYQKESLSRIFDLNADDCMLSALPFSSAFGYCSALWFPLLRGITVVYSQNPLDTGAMENISNEHRVTILIGMSAYFSAYARRLPASAFKYLRYAVCGAGRLRIKTSMLFREKFGVEPLECYGQAELGGVASVNMYDISWPGVEQPGHMPGTIGRSLPGVVMKIVDPVTFEDLGSGRTGLLLIKSPGFMLDYAVPGDKKAILSDGWYISGDTASIDDEGFVSMHGKT